MDIQNLLAQIVSFRSIQGENDAKNECLDWVIATFFDHCVHDTERNAYQQCPYMYVKHPEEKALWFAHLDVVPGTDDQFQLRKEGDKLYGRGTKDMKGPALSLLLAWKESVESGENPAVSILLTTDEEMGGDTIDYVIENHQLSPPFAYTPDCSGQDIIVEHKAGLWIRITIYGRSAHAAMPWEGSNAVQELASIIAKLQSRFPVCELEDWTTTCTPTSIQGGQAQNQVPDTASVECDIRFPVSEFADHEVLLREIEDTLPSTATVEVIRRADGLCTDHGHEEVQRLKSIATGIFEDEISLGREFGSTDARYFASHGIPSFLFGPEGGDLHGPQEWVSLSSLQKLTQVHREWLRVISCTRVLE